MTEKTVASQYVFKGRLLKIETLDVRLESGRKAVREIVRHPGAVLVLARTPDGRFVFVRQFRKPIERELLEAVAGTLAPGESPEACARRELREETGFEAGVCVHAGHVFTTPGFCDERIEVFFADVSAKAGRPSPDDDEVVHAVLLKREEIEGLISRGELTDAKTLAAWLMFTARPCSVDR